MKIAVVEVKTCEDCPFFDNKYYSYNQMCTKLDREIASDQYGTNQIPEDCPLEEKEI